MAVECESLSKQLKSHDQDVHHVRKLKKNKKQQQQKKKTILTLLPTKIPMTLRLNIHSWVLVSYKFVQMMTLEFLFYIG